MIRTFIRENRWRNKKRTRYNAADVPQVLKAVVSRGGRPDLAMVLLPHVTAPTLLIVGGAYGPVIDLNMAALDELVCVKRPAVVPGATHLYEEPGALEEVARLATACSART